MTSYKDLYFYLFGVIADAVEDFECGETILGIQRLISALREAEDRATEIDLVPEIYDIRLEGLPKLGDSLEELERYDIVAAKDDDLIE